MQRLEQRRQRWGEEFSAVRLVGVELLNAAAALDVVVTLRHLAPPDGEPDVEAYLSMRNAERWMKTRFPENTGIVKDALMKIRAAGLLLSDAGRSRESWKRYREMFTAAESSPSKRYGSVPDQKSPASASAPDTQVSSSG